MLFVVYDRVRRAEREGRRATKAELLEGLDEETAARRAEYQARDALSADVERLKAYVRDFCAAADLAQLSLWAEEKDGQIEVKMLARAKAPA
jgi:hypothetical protein